LALNQNLVLLDLSLPIARITGVSHQHLEDLLELLDPGLEKCGGRGWGVGGLGGAVREHKEFLQILLGLEESFCSEV
jgi:hypothetical protein